MIPATLLQRQEGRALRARRVRAGDRARAGRRRRRGARLGRQSRQRRQGRAARASPSAICARPTGAAFASLVLSPGVPLTHPKPHWTVELARGAGVEIIGDIELFARERTLQRAGRAVHRHHRHQRQVDDDGADRPHPQGGRPRRADGRQYRPRRDDARSADAGALLRRRVLVLPDRPGALDQPDRRHPAQSDARPSRPPRHDAALRRDQGAAGGRQRDGDHRRRRRLLRADRRPAGAGRQGKSSASPSGCR